MDFQTCVKTGPGAVVVSSPVRDFDELCVASSGRGPFADVTSVEEAQAKIEALTSLIGDDTEVATTREPLPNMDSALTEEVIENVTAPKTKTSFTGKLWSRVAK